MSVPLFRTIGFINSRFVEPQRAPSSLREEFIRVHWHLFAVPIGSRDSVVNSFLLSKFVARTGPGLRLLARPRVSVVIINYVIPA